MPVPGFEYFMLPMLELASDGLEHSLQEAREALAVKFKLTDDDRREMLPSGKQRTFDNRVAWAKVHLTKAALLLSTRRAYFKITERGRKVLQNPPEVIKVKFLTKYEEFRKFRGEAETSNVKLKEDDTIKDRPITPTDAIESAYQDIRASLSQELIAEVTACSPDFFEKLVLDLLIKMGYGGSRRDAAEAVGRSGDEGIDGIIKEDRLGLDKIYIQAKRWGKSVGSPQLRDFIGALQLKGATKGVFITTSTFTPDAIKASSKANGQIVLIDGDRLSDLMIDYGVGVSTQDTYEIKKIDSDYFEA